MSDLPFLIVAVDGGAASGKSTTSRAVAQRMKYLYVDSGAHYRKLTNALLEEGLSHRQRDAIRDTLPKLRLSNHLEGGESHLLINGKDYPREELRTPEMNANVSLFAAVREVRFHLLEYQRSQVAVARENGFAGLIMEGRDIGSVIFPEADFKFFLQASEEVRAKRREEEGQMDLIARRDAIDANRTTAPFVAADHSIKISTDTLNLEEVVDLIAGIIRTGRNPGSGLPDLTRAPFRPAQKLPPGPPQAGPGTAV